MSCKIRVFDSTSGVSVICTCPVCSPDDGVDDDDNGTAADDEFEDVDIDGDGDSDHDDTAMERQLHAEQKEQLLADKISSITSKETIGDSMDTSSSSKSNSKPTTPLRRGSASFRHIRRQSSVKGSASKVVDVIRHCARTDIASKLMARGTKIVHILKDGVAGEGDFQQVSIGDDGPFSIDCGLIGRFSRVSEETADGEGGEKGDAGVQQTAQSVVDDECDTMETVQLNRMSFDAALLMNKPADMACPYAMAGQHGPNGAACPTGGPIRQQQLISVNGKAQSASVIDVHAAAAGNSKYGGVSGGNNGPHIQHFRSNSASNAPVGFPRSQSAAPREQNVHRQMNTRSPIREFSQQPPHGGAAPSPVRFLQNGQPMGAMTNASCNAHQAQQQQNQHYMAMNGGVHHQNFNPAFHHQQMQMHQQQKQQMGYLPHQQQPQQQVTKNWPQHQQMGSRSRVMSPVRSMVAMPQQQQQQQQQPHAMHYQQLERMRSQHRQGTPPICSNGTQPMPQQVKVNACQSNVIIVGNGGPPGGKPPYKPAPPQQSHYANMAPNGSGTATGTGYPDQYVQAGIRPAVIGAEGDLGDLPPELPPPPPPTEDYKPRKSAPPMLTMKERSYSDSGLDKIADQIAPEELYASGLEKGASASEKLDSDKKFADSSAPDLSVKTGPHDGQTEGYGATVGATAVIGRPKRGANKLKAKQRRSAYGDFAAHVERKQDLEVGVGPSKPGRLSQPVRRHNDTYEPESSSDEHECSGSSGHASMSEKSSSPVLETLPRQQQPQQQQQQSLSSLVPGQTSGRQPTPTSSIVVTSSITSDSGKGSLSGAQDGQSTVGSNSSSKSAASRLGVNSPSSTVSSGKGEQPGKAVVLSRSSKQNLLTVATRDDTYSCSPTPETTSGIEEIRSALEKLSKHASSTSTSILPHQSRHSANPRPSSAMVTNKINVHVKSAIPSANNADGRHSSSLSSVGTGRKSAGSGGGNTSSYSSTSTYSSMSGSESEPVPMRLLRHSSLETVNTNVTAADEFVWVDSHNRLVELQQLPWTTHDVLRVVRRHQCQSNGAPTVPGGTTQSGIIDTNFPSSPCATTSSKHSNASSSSGTSSAPGGSSSASASASEGRVSVEAIPRLSYLLQRALVRIGREAQRLARPLGMCSKQEIAAALKIVVSPALADSCVKACLRASAMYAVSGDQLKQSKSTRAGLQLSVGRVHRWMADVRLGRFIHEYAVIYLTAALENLLEEIVTQCMPSDPETMLTSTVLETAIATNGDLWGLLQPYAHLNAGRTATGALSLPRWPSLTDTSSRMLIEDLPSGNAGTGSSSGSSGRGSSIVSSNGSSIIPATGAPKSMEQSLLTTCVGTREELHDLLHRAANFHYRHASRPCLVWTPSAVHALYYFMRCSQLEHTDHVDRLSLSGTQLHTTLQAPVQELTYERPYMVLPPLSEWIRVASAHVDYRNGGAVDQDDVLQAARLLLPGVDCPVRVPGFLNNQEEKALMKRREEDMETAEKLKLELAFRMLLSGRGDLLPHALQLLPTTKVNTLNEFGFTPLMMACFHGEESVVRHLVDAGAAVNAETPPNSAFGDTQYWTALTYASLAGTMSIAKYLIDRGAHVEGGARMNEDRCTETPLQVATSYGNHDMVSLLLMHGADPFLATTIKDSLCYSGTAQRGCYSAISVAAAHGQRGILHKLLSHPLNGSTKKDQMLSLEEILAEGSSNPISDKKGARLLVVPTCVEDISRTSTMSSGSDCSQVLKLTKSQVKALQEAMYHSAESGHLEITLDLRSLGVPWTLHCWMHTLATAHEHRLDNIIDQLLQDFLHVWPDDNSTQFIDECLPLLFSIFRHSKNEGTTLLLADIFSSCFGREFIKEIRDIAFDGGARIDLKFVNNPELSDVQFRVEGRVFYAHKIILVNASNRFRQMLSSKFVGDSNPPIVQINDIRFDIFATVMQYLYQGGCEELDVAPNDVLELMAASNFFQLDGLLRFCENRCSKLVDLDNIVSMYIHAKVYNAMQLLEYCQGFLLQNMVALLTYDDSVRRLIFGKKLHNHDVLSGLLLTLQARVKSRKTK